MASDSCSRLVVMMMVILAMGATIVALMTDYWYDVETEGLVSTQEKQESNFRFGLWRRCYDDRPETFPDQDVDRSGDKCIWIYKDLIPDDEGDLSHKEMVRIHLMRSVVGLSVGTAAFLLFATLGLLCAWAPGDCHTPQRTAIYTATLLLVVFAFMCSISSGICFIAARDVEDKDLHLYLDRKTSYLWSFMLHWVGSGLTLMTGCVLLYLLAHSYNDVTNKSHYYYSY